MPADSPAPSPPPLGVENYQLGAEISTGGMGSLLEAHDTKLDRTVAIKGMLLEANADAGMRQRVIREAQVLAMLAHPNIVPIYDIVWEDGLPLFYSMKLVKGRTLQSILNDLLTRMPLRCAITRSRICSTSSARSVTPSPSPTAKACCIAI